MPKITEFVRKVFYFMGTRDVLLISLFNLGFFRNPFGEAERNIYVRRSRTSIWRYVSREPETISQLEKLMVEGKKLLSGRCLFTKPFFCNATFRSFFIRRGSFVCCAWHIFGQRIKQKRIILSLSAYIWKAQRFLL